jgi:ketosteroid isomerase-like protein
LLRVIHPFPILAACAAAMSVVVTLAAQAEGPGSAKDLERLAAAERTWARSLETNDVKALEAFVDDACTFIGPDGQLEEHDAYLAGYRRLPQLGIQIKKVAIDQSRMRVLGDTAIVTGHVVAELEAQGTRIVENLRFTRVYARRGERWRMVAGQGTRIAPEAAPPR